MTATFESLLELDARLVRAGHLPLTPWWRSQTERFYAHPSAQTFVAQVGRGGVKSNASAKVGLNETLFGGWRIPPGERHFWAFVSRSKDEAAQRLLLLESFLRALSVRFDTEGDQIALRDEPRGFRVFACQVGAVSGFRCYGYSADELAKWSAGPEHANPAREVVASLQAMTITHPGARKLLVSSPFGVLDYHVQRFELGDTDSQLVANAPTWVANPSITEEQTRRAEPDERVWLREYAAIPQSEASSAFDPDVVREAFRALPEGLRPSIPIGVLDFSSGRSDATTWAIVQWCWRPQEPEFLTRREYLGRGVYGDPVPLRDHEDNPVPNPAFHGWSPPIIHFPFIGGIEGAFWRGLPAAQLVARMSADFARHGVAHVIGDQREAYLLQTEFARNGLRFESVPWTNERKVDAVARVRRWLRERSVLFAPHEKLSSELLNFQERITPSGYLTYGARGSSHDDYAALALTAAMAEAEGWIPSSPIKSRPIIDYDRIGRVLAGEEVP